MSDISNAGATELDPKYVDVIVQRFMDYAGKAATLDSDGRSFDDVADTRRSLSQPETAKRSQLQPLTVRP